MTKFQVFHASDISVIAKVYTLIKRTVDAEEKVDDFPSEAEAQEYAATMLNERHPIGAGVQYQIIPTVKQFTKGSEQYARICSV